MQDYDSKLFTEEQIERALEENNIRAYFLEVDFKDLSREYNTGFQFAKGEVNSGFICFKLLYGESGIILKRGCTVYANIRKTTGETFKSNLSVLDYQNGIVLLPLSSQVLSIVGADRLELAVVIDEEKTISPKIKYNVYESFDGDDKTDAENHPPLLDSEDLRLLITELRKEVESNRVDIEDLLEKTSSNLKLIQSNGNKIASNTSEIEKIKQHNANNDSKISNIENSIEENTNSISTNTNKIGELENKANTNESNISSNTSKIEAIEGKIPTVESGILDNASKIDKLETKIPTIETKISGNSSNISKIEAKVESLETSVSGNSSSIEEVKVDLEEIVQARTATTGEVFDTLDERIDHEVDRLNKKIDVTMLQQEDRENHTIENSVEGLTTDMVIKGKTLKNLVNLQVLRDYVAIGGATSDEETITWDFDNGNIPYNSWNYVYDVLDLCKPNKTYTVVFNVIENTTELINSGQKTGIRAVNWHSIGGTNSSPDDGFLKGSGIIMKKFSFGSGTQQRSRMGFHTNGKEDVGDTPKTIRGKFVLSKKILVLEGDLTNVSAPKFFDNIESFGQQEDKISISSKKYKYLYTNEEIVDLYNNMGYSNVSATLEDGMVKFPEHIGGWWNPNAVFKGKPSTKYTVQINGIAQEAYLNKLRTIRTNPDNSVVYETDSTGEFGILVKTDHFGNQKVNFIIAEGDYSSLPLEFDTTHIDKKDILLSQYGFDEGLRGFKRIKDELNFENSVAIKRIGKLVVNNLADFSFIEAGQSEDGTTIYRLQKQIRGYNFGELISSHFIPIEGNDGSLHGSASKGDAYYIGYTSDNWVRILLPKKIQTKEDALREIGDVEIVLYLTLETPVETPLDESIALKVYNEKTYVSFENSISGTSSFKAPVNTVATIARLNRENRALEEENRSLRQDFESTTLSLTDSDLELVKQNVDMDFRLMEVEFALDIPQSTLNSDIKFKNKKGEVKSMARTPYEMMKIVILSGDYDREDYIHKVGKYYERGRMTKEEHDELMSLMTADEVISKKI
ncbi:hypothetical protein P5F12_13675 [Clostridium perfringens]|nr:hypothetical protein [Clostridium perfringens]